MFQPIAQDSRVIFLHVGQGDATLVQKGDFQILVDTGPDDSVVYELPKYMSFFDHTIEIVILTHSHDDHTQGIFSILENYDVGSIYISKECFKSADLSYLETNYGSLIKDVSELQELVYEDISLNKIYPVKDECNSNVNNDSLVYELKLPQKKILLMGDAEVEVEEYLIENSLFEDVDILKTGHHCSKSSTSEMFLTTVKPELAICSVGEGNKFGHPHSETLKLLEEYNVQYLITYQEGNIVVK